MLLPLGFILSPLCRGASTMESKHPCSSALWYSSNPKHEWTTIHLHISTFNFKFQPCNHYSLSAEMVEIIPPTGIFVHLFPVNCIREVTPGPSLFCLNHDSRDLSALLNDLTILHLLRTSPHHFKSHHYYHQDPYFMFVMTAILFLTAGGCEAFIHT